MGQQKCSTNGSRAVENSSLVRRIFLGESHRSTCCSRYQITQTNGVHEHHFRRSDTVPDEWSTPIRSKAITRYGRQQRFVQIWATLFQRFCKEIIPKLEQTKS